MVSELRDCPICRKKAKLGYACGDYFISCSPTCLSVPMCDHPNPMTTAKEWNTWVDKVNSNKFLKLKVWIRHIWIDWNIEFELKRVSYKLRDNLNRIFE